MVAHARSQLTEECRKSSRPAELQKEYETSIKCAEPLSQTEVIKSLVSSRDVREKI